ncbi:MAG: aminopeptidase, partial [Clostridia bacterium]|nr:aminopeptidase [Clostridia bacterium]
MSEIKTPAEAARELLYKKKSVYERRDEAAIEAAYEYAVGYAKYLDAAKTEREAVNAAIELAEAEGFISYSFGDKIKEGGKYYYNNRGKNLFLFSIGSEAL